MRPTRREFVAVAAFAATRASAHTQDWTSLTLQQASEALRRKKVSAVELTDACLRGIEGQDSRLHSFITVLREQALASARAMDAERQRGKHRSPLHGVPIAVKDNIDTAGIRTTAASNVFRDRVPSEDADVIRRLRNAGAVIIGKANLHEFAYGGTSHISAFGAVNNPWAVDHVSGGSSGGSAAAVAARFCYGALGTDTAGSVRIPSSYCGVVGFKPTYGRVSNRGIVPLSWTLDHCGPITRTVEDAAMMLQAMAGYDALDPPSADVAVPDYSRAMQMRTGQLRFAVPRSPFYENLDPEVAQAVESALGVLNKLARNVGETSVPATFPLLLPLTGPEAHAYHAKFLAESPDRYQPFTRERILEFAKVTAQDYAAAVRQTNLLRREVPKVFAGTDLLVTPTMPKPAEKQAEAETFDPLGLQNTSPFDIFGLPTISVPCGFTRSGLPIGLQISGAPFAETNVLALAHAYERATDWHNRLPNL